MVQWDAQQQMLPEMKRWYADAYLKFAQPCALADLFGKSKGPPPPKWKRWLNRCSWYWEDFRIWLSRKIYPWSDDY